MIFFLKDNVLDQLIEQKVRPSIEAIRRILGTGSNSTAEAIDMTALAHKAGADAAYPYMSEVGKGFAEHALKS